MLDAVLEQIRRTHAGDPWYGSPRTRFLQDVAAADAVARPMGSAFSIWELVLHMTSWTNEVRRRLAGGAPGEPKDGDWPTVGEPTEARWQAALARLEEAHAALVADVSRLTEADTRRAVGEQRDPALGTGVTIGGMLVGIAQHDAYHIGQLALLRRALASGHQQLPGAGSAATAIA
jgi:uncharacterized damage-inducible protein DinB